MSLFLSAIGRVVDVLLSPFERLPALAGLAGIACVAAIGALLVMKLTSDQVRVAAVRRGLQAAMYEIWLFRGDMRAMRRAVGEVARLNATYLRLSLVPALWMIVPGVLVATHLQEHYGYRGLDVGRPALLTLHVSSDRDEPSPRLRTAAGLRIETPAVWIPSLREFDWRIVPDRPGDYEISVEAGSATASRIVTAVDPAARVRPIHNVRMVDSAGARSIEAISVTYPRSEIGILGYSCHWSIPFLAMLAAFAWMLRRRVGVAI